ncbi:hypothetical protein QVD17_41645 [Tagetes erecta]|uniref:Uncharacterized protein n=1 Tax=Tagetes erecta TaxID=13708 RepID=A0AAD8NFR2_TARER|nr:hypothetical protein QVD17_41645 [Tagetes erecta]
MSQLPESSSSSLNRSSNPAVATPVTSNEQGGYEGFIPSEFNVLFGKTFAFKIDITKYNIEYGYPLYTILKYNDDMVIVTELEDRFVDDNAADTPSDNRHSKYFPEELTPSNIEKTSVIDESNTQNVSIDKSFGKRIMMEDNDEVPVDGGIVLKRNQKEVYDLEENEESLVTKSRTNVDDGQFDSGKFLLTPKEEKNI